MTDEEIENKIEQAERWAHLDGCEGGDYLGSLAAALGTCHYSYAVPEATVAGILTLLIDAEIGGMRSDAVDRGPDGGWDAERTTALLAWEKEHGL